MSYTTHYLERSKNKPFTGWVGLGRVATKLDRFFVKDGWRYAPLTLQNLAEAIKQNILIRI